MYHKLIPLFIVHFAPNCIVQFDRNNHHIRAYAANAAGTGYGPDITFTTKLIETPIVNAAENINQSGFTAKWIGSATATGYLIDIATDIEFTEYVYSKDWVYFYHKDVNDVLTFDVRGLNENTTYFYRVRAYSTDGTSLNSNIITVTTLPFPAPIAKTAENVHQTSFTATWDSTVTATGYYLDVSTKADFTDYVYFYDNTWVNLSNKDVKNVTTFEVKGLNPNTTYYYRIRAYCEDATSLNSNIITVTTLPFPPPIAVSAENVRQTSFKANWTSSTTATEYYLYVNTDIEFKNNFREYYYIGNVTSLNITGLNPNTTYYYRLKAHNSDATSSYSNIVTVTTLPNPPSAPSSNTATDILQTSFTSNWSSTSTATGYHLDVATDNAFTAFVSGYNNKDIGNVTSSSVTSLTANTPYYYRVRAYNTGGDSPNSNTITVTTLPNPPVASVANTATNIIQTSFTANWGSVATATGYRLDVATDNAFTAFVSGFNNKDIGNVTSSSVTGLTANTPYYYRVRAYNTGGDSPNSNKITVTTLPTPPIAPSANSAATVLQTSFIAKWSSSATATGYRLDVATNIGFTAFVTGYNDKDVSNVLTYNVTALNAKTQYYYRVRAYNTGGTSDNSNVMSVSTLSNPPSAPLELSVFTCHNIITLKWRKNAEPDVAKYRIYGGSTTNPTTVIDSIDNTSVPVKEISGLNIGQKYYFRVTAVNQDGPESPMSIEVSETIGDGYIPTITSKWKELLICSNLQNTITKYQWYKGSSAISNANSQFYSAEKTTGVYKVETTDKNGCQNFSNAISITRISSLSVYPNPTSVDFTLKLNDESEGRAVVSLLNSKGIKVMEFQTEKLSNELILKEIPVNNLQPGVHVIQVLMNQKDSYTAKIIIKK